MKAIALAILVALVPTASANEDDEYQKLLGAIAGGYLFSTIGAGDGKTAATVIGAIAGYRYGPQLLDPNAGHTENRHTSIQKLCDRENPYKKDSRLYVSYNRGCIRRVNEEIRELEQQAYEQGYQRNR